MENSQKFGIEGIKALLIFSIGLYLNFAEKTEAPKTKLGKFLFKAKAALQLSTIFEVLPALKNVKNEIADLDEREYSELRILVAEELDIRGAKVDRVIKSSLSFAISAVKFYFDISKIKNETLEGEISEDENPLAGFPMGEETTEEDETE